jgi:hypothetical protein
MANGNYKSRGNQFIENVRKEIIEKALQPMGYNSL